MVGFHRLSPTTSTLVYRVIGLRRRSSRSGGETHLQRQDKGVIEKEKKRGSSRQIETKKKKKEKKEASSG